MNDAITMVEPGCWVLRHPDGGTPDFGDWGDRHHPSEEAAREHAQLVAGDRCLPLTLVPVKQPGACYIATSACGYEYDEEDEGVEHWPTSSDLYSTLLDAGWKPVEGGGMTCADRDLCDVCAALPLAAVPAVIPGQMALPLDGAQ